MDGNRFDRFTRELVTGANRRSFLKVAASALAGITAMRVRAADAVCSPGGWYCQRHSDCCSRRCYLPSRNRFRRVCDFGLCQPLTCEDFGGLCGDHENGCGGEISCPCPIDLFCLSNGTCAQLCGPENACPCGECFEDVDSGEGICAEVVVPSEDPCTNTVDDCPAGTFCSTSDGFCHPVC